MIINWVTVQSYRSIDNTGMLALGPVTVLIGRNNSGKSALLRAMYLAQGGSQFQDDDRRLRSSNGLQVDMALAAPSVEPVEAAYGGDTALPPDVVRRVAAPPGNAPNVHLVWNKGEAARNVGELAAWRPRHLFVPVFSRRKVSGYENGVDDSRSRSVGVTDRDLTALLHSLSGDHAEGRRYRELVKRVLGPGTSIGTFATQHGQQPGLPISQYEGVSLERMGEGVSGVVTILAELASPGRRVLLLEEPENDLHPEALRELLGVILQAVDENGYQVVVSTHSDLVLRTLGSAAGAVVYRTTLEHATGGVPTTTYLRVDSAIDRREALADLGYDVTEPIGWLIFEESTAERFFREVLIPGFVPKLAGFRTLAAGGTGRVKKVFEDLRRFMLFVQKSDDPEPTPRAWVVVDGDKSGSDVAEDLMASFSRWPADRFIALNEPAIEKYYPRRFAEHAAAIEAAHVRSVGWQEERELKGKLVQEVCSWFNGPDGSRAEVEETAGELIETLQAITSAHADLYR
ncbi:putative ATPase [Kribbella aluminosa]|uniref:ATPase n=1 Tax=Kribbella aluminosa TaxID=416017 RepID=A0ABS4UJI7_9ACTN|nr:ATP-binding protein [Kribbella aluminosa]MBP2351779.1 putative ATPase [Kribbella aluminosa]